eukprot:2283777-Alexandrium_andersonii.AAC.1
MLCNSLAAFVYRWARVAEKGPASPRTAAFLEAHPEVDQDATALLLDASAAVRRAVIDEGPLRHTRNPSSVLMERVKRNERTGPARW